MAVVLVTLYITYHSTLHYLSYSSGWLSDPLCCPLHASGWQSDPSGWTSDPPSLHSELSGPRSLWLTVGPLRLPLSLIGLFFGLVSRPFRLANGWRDGCIGRQRHSSCIWVAKLGWRLCLKTPVTLCFSFCHIAFKQAPIDLIFESNFKNGVQSQICMING